ncbi:MAG: FtsB family cell division protein [Desulfobaccales bacterium]
MTSAAAPGGNGKTRLSTRLVALITGIICLVLMLFVFFSRQGVYQLYRLRQEKARLDAENHRLAEENARLARIVDRLHNDKVMIQDLIRQELNFIKKNEIIIQLPPGIATAPSQATILPDRPAAAAKEEVGTPPRPASRRPAAEPRKTKP